MAMSGAGDMLAAMTFLGAMLATWFVLGLVIALALGRVHRTAVPRARPITERPALAKVGHGAIVLPGVQVRTASEREES
jgi:hypothetical protein